MSEQLTPFWIRGRGWDKREGFGVTAVSREDAFDVLREAGEKFPDDLSHINVTEIRPPDDLDAMQVNRICGPTDVRGIWFRPGGEAMKKDRVIDLMQPWLQRAQGVAEVHYRAATRLERLHYRLGIPLIILSAMTGTTIFATLNQNPSLYVKLFVASAGLGCAVLASLQTFLKFEERAIKHHISGTRYGSLQRELELQIANSTASSDDLLEFAEDFRARWDKINEDSPNITEKFSPAETMDRQMVSLLYGYVPRQRREQRELKELREEREKRARRR